MRKTIKIIGHLVNSEFDVAEAMAKELDYIGQQDKALQFLHQLSAMILAHVYFTRGQFQRSLMKIDEALNFENPIETIEVTWFGGAVTTANNIVAGEYKVMEENVNCTNDALSSFSFNTLTDTTKICGVSARADQPIFSVISELLGELKFRVDELWESHPPVIELRKKQL
jgi:hypothetical protein